jgi:hypothetical protein
MLASLMLGSYLSYLLFESQTYRIRRIVKDLFVRGIVTPATSAATAPTER